MIPDNATHVTQIDGITTYYQLIYWPFPYDQLEILVWCQANQGWFESAYDSLQDFENDGLELIEL